MVACEPLSGSRLGPTDGVQGRSGTESQNGSPDAPSGSSETHLCAGVEQEKIAQQLRRLTQVQYKNTIEAAFGAVPEGDLPNFSDDNPTIGLANDPSKLRITAVSIDSVYASAQAIANHATTRSAPVADCVAASGNGCFEGVIDEMARALWRRPVAAEEKQDLMDGLRAVIESGGTRLQQMEFLLQAMLMSPNTLYRTELGSGGDALLPYEIASLLSYAFWDSPPDAALMAKADTGEIMDPGVRLAEVRRMIQDPRFADTLASFFWDYLKLEDIYSVPKDTRFGLDAAAREALATSARATLVSKFRSVDSGFMDVFRGQDFQVNAGSAPFFGISEEGLSGESVAMTMGDGEREGLLSHPAFLAVHAGQASTSIVKRGVFALEQLLGFQLPEPPEDIMGVDPDDLPEFDPETTSSRELLQLTHSGQPRCAGCHQFIDPAGFGFENFDAVGRFRTTEKENVSIDASGEVTIAEESIRFQDGPDYFKALADSATMRKTVLKNYYAYVLGQVGNGCEVERLSERVEALNDTAGGLAESIAELEGFVRRRQGEQ